MAAPTTRSLGFLSTGAGPIDCRNRQCAGDTGGLTIKSPTIGPFYATPAPTDPPFVSVGSVVTPETVVCTIEQMKVFNQIQAGVSGTITAILVKSGDAVEFDTPLFRYSS